MFEPLARDEAVFAGQPLALVVAESEAAASDAVDLVVVDAEPLPTVIDLLDAMTPSSVPARVVPTGAVEDDEGAARAAHAAVGGRGADVDDERLSDNVTGRKRYVRGEAHEALAGGEVVVEGTFRTSWVYQAYLEPHVATAWLEPDGTLAVETSTQGTFYARRQLAKIFGLPASGVRVHGAPLGGAFGSKVIVVEPLVAGAALALRRPVRLALTRREDFAATNPASASAIELKIGANRSGQLTALEARLVFDAGAYTEWSIESIAAVLIGGPYQWAAFDVRAYAVRTNRFGTGSYRAPGAPQTVFALESLVDELAVRLGIDPIELRLANLAEPDTPMLDDEPWPRIGARECLEVLRGHPLWRDRASLPSDEGVGLALAYWPGGKEPAAAVCRLEPDGTLAVITGVVDMSGATNGFGLIAAQAFGVRPDQVRVVTVDTGSAPQSPLSGGSVVTYSAGRAVEAAASDARRQLLEFAALELEIDPGDLEIVDGTVRPLGSPERGVSVAILAEKAHDFGGSQPPIEGHGRTVPKSLAPSAAAHLVHVRIDRETGRVTVPRVVVAQDVGRALNPALVEGQMMGGTIQGIGWGLYERLVHDGEGQLLTGSFLDYAVPTASSVPAIETVIVEVPAPDGPFGAKGIGEASVVAVGGAIANAVAAACGARPRELPIRPRWVWSVLRDGGGSG
ncbi:MAG: xanthine dehydrogenase family protein molybdopterin-binding subunit [Chloroflexi bacterium]|nr:MAG: xanthine dehydrogenase family protein molybdopterin-binding subunit [Chloroflexota bacterium]